ncbi:MAG: 3-deoxy-D-manno-octulosonic acid transferase, partial [Paludibacteraceae bacterium]|nr:3-deoxy-D-manno-octulosonic acid transferase [Paludibacteraceae bacterium]
LVVGSSWGPDEDLLTRYINERAGRMKMIIAPHEVHEERIKELTSKLTCKYVLYTKILNSQFSTLNSFDVLVVNTIGVLSSVYQYGQVAYIGGGFGVGIHNTLEAAAWGMPLVFGPNYHKFQEAKELIECGAGQSIKNYEECARALDEFFEKNEVASKAAAEYVASHTGATEIIYNSQFIVHNYSPIGS